MQLSQTQTHRMTGNETTSKMACFRVFGQVADNSATTHQQAGENSLNDALLALLLAQQSLRNTCQFISHKHLRNCRARVNGG